VKGKSNEVKRSLTIYFFPFKKVPEGGITSKRILVINARGKVTREWKKPNIPVEKPMGKVRMEQNTFGLLKEFLSHEGIDVTQEDRIYRLVREKR